MEIPKAQPPYELLELACDRFELGALSATPEKATGGLSHEVWKCATSAGQFAVKRMIARSTEPDFVSRLSASFKIEQAMTHAGIPVAEPITLPGTKKALATIQAPLQGEQKAHLVRVHRWIEASPVTEDQLDAEALAHLGEIIGHVHNVALPESTHSSTQHPYTPPAWSRWSAWDMRTKASWHEQLLSAIPDLAKLNLLVSEANQEPAHRLVGGHQDVNGKNVLRGAHNKLWLIDWDSAQMVESDKDAGTIALDWSGLREGAIEEDRIEAFLQGYENSAGRKPDTADPAMFSNWAEGTLKWLEYNLERSFSVDPSQRALGEQEVRVTLGSIALASAWIFNRA